MLRGLEGGDSWLKDAENAIFLGSKYLLSFNEPDFEYQSNISAKDAALAHIKYMSPFTHRAKIGAPAVTNGQDTMGINWLMEFFSYCDGKCPIDFVPFHWYKQANATEFKTYVQQFTMRITEKYGITRFWITEFGCGESEEETSAFLHEVLPWLDANENVERYAYFKCGVGPGLLLGSEHSLSQIGEAYVYN
jgi:Glycosyl hydrolase catalytic core